MNYSNPLRRNPAPNGALLIDKPVGITSFGVVATLKRALREHSGIRGAKIGHGGTLDPFATGLLVVMFGDAAKLARYFLGSDKAYRGVIRFGETTIPGDPTDPISERSDVLPESLEQIRAVAAEFASKPMEQIPPMHSAKKVQGRPLYELAREGIEIERKAITCHLREFTVIEYSAPRAEFQLRCSSGTYVRTLAQDVGKALGTVALLESLSRTASGYFSLSRAQGLQEVVDLIAKGTPWDELPAWIPFDRLLEGMPSLEATHEEARDLVHGQSRGIFHLLNRAPRDIDPPCLAIMQAQRLLAVARKEDGRWMVDRVFTARSSNR